MSTYADGTVGKAIDVLELVADFDRPVRFTELLARSAFPKATLYRLLQTLVSRGMLSFDRASQNYYLGIRFLRLAHCAWRNASLAPIARPFLDRLSDEIGETVHLAQLDHAQVLYVDKRNARQLLEMYSEAGKVGPAYCTGVGKAMLAFADPKSLPNLIAQQSFHRFTANTLTTADELMAELSAIRRRGHAFDNEEHEPGIICVAVPITSAEGNLLGAMSVTSSTQRSRLAALEELVPQIRESAVQIGREMESWRFPEEESGS